MANHPGDLLMVGHDGNLHVVQELSGGSYEPPEPDPLALAKALVKAFERLPKGATLRDLHELLKADIVEAELKKPEQPSLDVPTIADDAAEFARVFGGNNLWTPKDNGTP